MRATPTTSIWSFGDRARRWRADYNRVHAPPLKTDTWTDPLLPGRDDEDRLALEAAACELGILVRRRELGEVYVRIRIIGPAKPETHAVVLDAVPAVTDRSGWFLDMMPGRATRPGEIVWSNLIEGASMGAEAK